MYNRYIPNPDGSYQKQRVFESGRVEQTETVPAWNRRTDAPGTAPVSSDVGGPPEKKDSRASLSDGRLNITMDDLLVLAVLLLLLLDEDDDQLLVVLAALAFLIL